MNTTQTTAKPAPERRPVAFINRFGQGQRETVSECTSWKDARAELNEYQLSDPSASYWISTRCCAAWREGS